MPKYLRNWIIAGLAAIVTGAFLTPLGLGGLAVGIVGAAVFVLTNLALKNGYGRRKVVLGNTVQRDDALSATPGRGRASLVIFRDGGRPAIGIDIILDGQPVARLKGDTFTQATVAPGRHTVGATFTQGILGQIPIVTLDVDIPDSGVIAVAAAPPTGISNKGVVLRETELNAALRARLGAMSFAQSEDVPLGG